MDRHKWNLEGRRQGRLDSPLTALGVLQVRGNAERIRREPVDAIFASPLGRARASAETFATTLAREREKYSFRFPGGESYADADARAGRALAGIAQVGARRPLLVSHEMVGRMLLKQLGGLNRAEALRLSHPSDLVYRVEAGQIDRPSLPATNRL
jgi:probable phosphoglycerate mutase